MILLYHYRWSEKSNASICFTCCVLGGILVSVVRVCNAAVNDGKICSGASMQ